jgi:galactose mutarotase-like enzyme
MRGGPAPDHGDFWQLAWKVTETSDKHLRLQATGFSVPLFFSKELILEGGTLHIRYQVDNLALSSTPFLYAVHPLFAVSQGDRILLPQEVDSLALYYSRHNRLGTNGMTIPWPETKYGISLDAVEDASTGIAEMLYTGRLRDARCGIYRSSHRQGIKMTFELDKLPYLGLWICYGGWPENSTQPLQYAVALEPTTAPCGTLDEALRQNLAITLGVGESFAWEIRFQVTAPDISFEEFSSSGRSPEALPSP